MSTSKLTVCAALNEYCFQNMWNEPTSESRVNIKPHLVNNSRSCTGYCVTKSRTLKLPTTADSYFVYRFTKENAFGVFNVDTDTWHWCPDLCNDNDILVHVYTPNGRMIPKSDCFIYVNSDNNAINLAIKKSALNALSEDRELYITLYCDSDIVGNTTVYPRDTHSTLIYQLEQLAQLDDQSKGFVYLNGLYTTASVALSSYTQGTDLLELIIDEDIVGEVEIDVTNAGNIFLSDKDNIYKHILHIPKDLNPNNAVITHNTCSMYAIDQNTNLGTYVHYTSTKTVGQITHNDLSIPTYVVDAHKDYLDTNNLKLVLKFRTHSKDNRLLRNSNYIDLLYLTQTDDQIIQHLLGEIDPSLTFWKASELEQHPYIEMMFDVPNVITEDTMDYYVEALGYYHVAALLCRRVYTYQVTDYSSRTMVYPKPYIWTDYTVYPVVYLNGIKVHNQYVKYQNNSDGTISIGFTSDIYMTAGDTITTYLFPRGNTSSYLFTPTFDSPSFTFTTGEYNLYRKVDHGTIEIHGMYKDVNYGYVEQDIVAGKISVVDNSNGTTTITFNEDYHGTTFLLQYSTFTRYFSKDLADDIDENKNFVIDLEEYAVGSDELVPILNWKDAVVYFNGKYLVKGVDYEIVAVDAYDGSISMVQLIVQNMSYGRDDGDNLLEAVISSVELEDADTGYVIADMASEDIDVDIWFSGLSTLHVRGKYEYDVTSTGIGLILPEGKHTDGSIFELKTSIPTTVKDLLSPNTGDKDKEYINAIETYLNTYMTDPDQDVILEGSHRIVSSYLNFIINGMLDGTIEISYDPDTERMANQLETYSYLKQFDVMFREEDPLNLRFIDIYPVYSERTVNDAQLAKVIRLLTTYILPEDNYTSGVVPNE